MKQLYLITFIISVVLSSCVSKKDYELLEQSKNGYLRQLDALQIKQEQCESSKQTLQRQVDALKVQIKEQETTSGTYNARVIELEKENEVLRNSRTQLEQNNAQLINQLESLSIINQQGAESIKQSLQTLNSQSNYIRLLNNKVQSRDSLNFLLACTFMRSLKNFNDTDIDVQV